MKEMVGGCCVCSDERGWSENPLVYCDGAGCNVAVHQACYGIISVPTGPWFCRKCESQERTARVKCELCPLKEGALKRTDTGGWCHVVCALFIPEAWFGNVQTMEPIILKGLPPERFNKPCYICEEQNRAAKAASGACMQCNKNGCKHHFHVTCAQAQGLLCEEAGTFMDNVKYCGYCSYHYKKLKKDSHIKVIPAFKPIQPENITPQSSPDKAYLARGVKVQKPSAVSSSANQNTTMPKTAKMLALISEQPPALLSEQAKEKSKSSISPVPTSSRPTPTAISTVSSSSSGSDSEPYNSPPSNKSVDQQRITDIKATGKFTTANFTETTITPSPANFGDLPASSAAGPEEADRPAGSAEKKPSEKVSDSGLSSSLSSDSGESDKTAMEIDNTDKKDTSVPPVDPHAKPSKSIASSKAAPNQSNAGVCKPPASNPQASSAANQNSFSYNYENFLSKNYPGTTSAAAAHERDQAADKLPAKRARSRSTDKKRSKKPKVDKPASLSAGAKAKDAPMRSLPSPTTSPQLDAMATETAVLKKSMNKKKKEGSLGFGLGGATAFGTTPVSVSSLLKHGVGSEERLATNQHGMPSSATPPPPGLVAETLGTNSAATTSGSHDLTDGIMNGPTLIGPSSSHKSLSSPSRVVSDNNHSAAQLPTSMEQLLERQWDQGSHFLMEQGQHFDIASLLNCLHQLRQENQRLEEHIASLSARRDQLLAVNARLSLPLNPALVHPTPGAAASSQETGSHGNRGSRVNNFLPPEGATVPQDLREVLSRTAPNRSPGQAQSPAQNHLSTPTTQSPSSQISQVSNHTSPAASRSTGDNRSQSARNETSAPPVLSAAVSSSSTSVPPGGSSSDQQRLLLHQQQLLLGSQLPADMQQQLMLQMLHHQQQVAAASSSMATATPHVSQASSKSTTDKSKEKT